MPVTTNKKQTSRGFQRFKHLLTSLFLGANICTILLLWVSCLSTWIPTSDYPRFSILGLAFPVFVIVNLAFVVFWLIFKIRFIWVPLLGLACVWGYVQDYYPIHFSQSEKPENCLKMISYNGGGAKDTEKRNEIVEYLKHENADIICLQEYTSSWLNRADVSSVLDSMKYQTMKNGGLCIISKLPIVSDSIPIKYPTRSNHSLACMIEYEGDTILLINNHLESNKFTPEEKTEIGEMIEDPQSKEVEEKGKFFSSKIAEAAKYRGAQADSIYEMIEKHSNYSILVCGDFNDTPISYTYQKIDRLLKSAYKESGKGLGISYNQKGFYVRIDHIFVSKDWKTFDTHIDSDILLSDHYPLVTNIRKNTK